MTIHTSASNRLQSERRHFAQRSIMLFTALTLPLLLNACSKKKSSFKSTDITGANFAQKLQLQDQSGKTRTLQDFQGRVVVIFFGYTQCPDVCPTSMTTMAEVKRLLGKQGDLLEVVFITVDPERDTLPLLKAYMENFDPRFVALRPAPETLSAVASDFKVYFRKVPGSTPTSYTMDHSAGKYIFDQNGRVRLFSPYGTSAATIADDIRILLSDN